MLLIWYAGLRRHARRLIGRLSAGVRRLARPDDAGCDDILSGDHSGLDGLARRCRLRWRRQPDQAIPRQPGDDFSGGCASLQWLSGALSTSRGRLAECTNRLQLTALIRESPRVDVSRPSRCSCPCGNSAARGRTGLSSSSTKASQIVRRASWRRRSARTDVPGRVPMDARMVQYG